MRKSCKRPANYVMRAVDPWSFSKSFARPLLCDSQCDYLSVCFGVCVEVHLETTSRTCFLRLFLPFRQLMSTSGCRVLIPLVHCDVGRLMFHVSYGRLTSTIHLFGNLLRVSRIVGLAQRHAVVHTIRWMTLPSASRVSLIIAMCVWVANLSSFRNSPWDHRIQ